IEAIFGPFSNSTFFASFFDNGASNKASLFTFFGSFMSGYFMSTVRGSVITPVIADAAAVSGLHKNTLSSFVPERPGKFLGVVRKLFLHEAGACPIPIHRLQPV